MEATSELREERILDLAPWPEEQRIRSTTGTRAAAEQLAGRVEALEQAVRQLSAAVSELRRSSRGRGL